MGREATNEHGCSFPFKEGVSLTLMCAAEHFIHRLCMLAIPFGSELIMLHCHLDKDLIAIITNMHSF